MIIITKVYAEWYNLERKKGGGELLKFVFIILLREKGKRVDLKY